MADTTDTANVIIRPPVAWAVAVLAGLALNWLMPLPFLPAASPAGWLGAMVFALALALVAWAIATITRVGSNVPTRRSTTTIVDTGPYRVTRNPIYLGILGLIGLAIDPQQPLAVADAGALRPRHPLRCSRPRGSLSRAKLRRCLPLPSARAALAVLPAKMVPSQGALQHSAKDGFPPAATGLLCDTQI
jgi:Phospholipid methyltransferase